MILALGLLAGIRTSGCSAKDCGERSTLGTHPEKTVARAGVFPARAVDDPK
jgi:hypothetical protein